MNTADGAKMGLAFIICDSVRSEECQNDKRESGSKTGR